MSNKPATENAPHGGQDQDRKKYNGKKEDQQKDDCPDNIYCSLKHQSLVIEYLLTK